MANIKRRKRSAEELPLGDALDRLFGVVASINATPKNIVNEHLEQEKAQLIQALNAISVRMGFECRIDLDGDTADLMESAEESDAPTALELIKQGASSSCCRITQAEQNIPKPRKPSTSRARSTSRAK